MSKIVHIMLTGPVTDGWSYQDNLLTKYHKRIGNDVTIITSQWIWNSCNQLEKSDKSNYINIDGVKVIRLPIIGRDSFDRKFKRFKDLLSTIKIEAPDILFIHGLSFVDIKVVVRYIKKRKETIRVFIDNHADFSNSGSNWISRNILHKIIWRHYANIINPYVEKFYGVLPARVDWLINMYKLPKDKCHLLIMGADDDKIAECESRGSRIHVREKYGIKDDDFLIVTGGKIDIAKKQTVLLMEAVKEIPENKLKLIVFGSIVDELKNQIDTLSDGERIQYIGWVDGDKSYEVFSAADLVVFAGRHSVYWEQVVAMGIPMICKYWEGTTHVDIGGNVVFIMSDCVKDIKEIIEKKVLNSDKYSEMNKAAKSERRADFLYSNIANNSIRMEGKNES